jgi:hypothetical protein
LEITHPNSTLVVDTPVDISGAAINIPRDLFPILRIISIHFDNSQVYPMTFDENGIIKRGELYLNKAQDNKMVGTTTLCWPLEGQYKARFEIEYMNGDRTPRMPHDDAIITVYPKSEITQIKNNMALIDLAFAAYIAGLVGALSIIFQLMGWL